MNNMERKLKSIELLFNQIGLFYLQVAQYSYKLIPKL